MPAFHHRYWSSRHTIALVTMVAINLAVLRAFAMAQGDFATSAFLLAPCWNLVAVAAWWASSIGLSDLERAGRKGFVAGVSLMTGLETLYEWLNSEALKSRLFFLRQRLYIPVSDWVRSTRLWGAQVISACMEIPLIWLVFLVPALLMGLICSHIARRRVRIVPNPSGTYL